MSGFQAFVLGIVQGLTEFLPISSTAHLRIVPHLLGWQDPGAAFSAVIQLGTLLAVMIYFRKDIVLLIREALRSIVKQNLKQSQESYLAWAIAAGTIPIVVMGILFKNFIEQEARSLQLIGSSLIVFAVLLYLSERFSRQNRKIYDLSVKQVIFIGICQAFALIPGCSRSGSTIMGGLFLGLDRENAARFSFLLGLPAIAGSGFLQLHILIDAGLSAVGFFNLSTGILAAFVSGYLSIELLLRFIKKYGTIIFVFYRVALGSLVLTIWT